MRTSPLCCSHVKHRKLNKFKFAGCSVIMIKQQSDASAVKYSNEKLWQVRDGMVVTLLLLGFSANLLTNRRDYLGIS